MQVNHKLKGTTLIHEVVLPKSKDKTLDIALAKKGFESKMDKDGTVKITKELWFDVLDKVDLVQKDRKLLIEVIEKLSGENKSLKEGRVLSEKSRKLIKQCTDMLLQLYEATEPPKQEEIEIDINLEKPKDKTEKETKALTDKIELLLKNKIEKLVEDRLKQLKGKVE